MPKPIAAVIIPTIGTRKTKRPLLQEEQVRAWGKLMRTVIVSAQRSMERAGFEPRIILVDNSLHGLSPLHRQQLAKTDVEILFAPNQDPYESFRVGSRKAIQERDAQVVLTCFDDYEAESAHLDKMVKRLAENKADFVFGRWTPAGLRSFPRTQVLNETTVSYLTTFANPNLEMKAGESFRQAVERAKQQGKDIQTFHGLMAMNANAFSQMDRFIQSRPEFKQLPLWGLEPLLALAAAKTHARMEGILFPRRFEHFYPKSAASQAAFAKGRLKQFEAGITGIKRFLEATNQRQKIPTVERIAQQASNRFSRVPVLWRPGSKKRLERFQAFKRRTQRKTK